MQKRFQRRIENFTCAHCGAEVTGTGYTNHCPKCLWSMHVDVNPGDREETCKGMMEPIGLEHKNQAYFIIHRCQSCKAERRIRASSDDDYESILALARGG